MSHHLQSTMRSERGIALVLSLFLMAALSILGASLMFLSQTETYGSMNYKLMSQARYGAESGIHKAINHLLNSYTIPGYAGDPLSNYNTDVSPVTYNGLAVVLSASSATANYPIADVQTAFNAAGQGSLANGATSVHYATSAKLMSMQQVNLYGGGTAVIQTWLVTSEGTINGARSSTVEVTSTLETQVIPAHTFAAFAQDQICGALTFSGGASTDSYDLTSMSMTGTPPHPATQSYGGDVGTNGNLTETGTTTIINGQLYTPRTGTGTCHSGANGAGTALTQSGHATVTGGMVHLPQALAFPTPPAPNPLPPTTTINVNSATCASFGLSSPATCSGGSGAFTIDPHGSTISLGDVKLTGGSSLTLVGGTYNVNSISLSGGSSVTVASGAVIMNIAGKDPGHDDMASPADFTGGTVTNGSFNPANFQVLYGGTGNVKMSGGTSTSGVVYAPNASVTMTGGSDFYGTVLGKSVTDTGGTHFHYDRNLGSEFFITGNPMLTTFSWKKY